MSLFFTRSAALPEYAAGVGVDLRSAGGARVSRRKAMTHSVVWAATQLRADLTSLMPVDVYRPTKGRNLEVDTPPVLQRPAEFAEGKAMTIGEWLYATQVSLDTTGNAVGLIRAFDAMGVPAQIEPVDMDEVSFTVRGTRIVEYRIAGELVDSKFIWHERQYTAAGIPVGLSPITFAALQLSSGIAAQEFARDWFSNGAVPSAILRNSKRTLTGDQATAAKKKFQETIRNGDVFTTGSDWEYVPVSAKAAESGWIDQMQYTNADICRFMRVPADMVDVGVDGSSSITYANITQRNLQLLVMNLGGSIKRREDALSQLTPGGRFVKLNRNAVLAMDAKSRADLLKTRIDARTITPDEARAIEDQPPLNEDDYQQFDRLFGARGQKPQQNPGGTNG